MLAPHATLTAAELHTLRTARVAIPVADAVFRVEGPGAITCLQGLLSSDVAKLASGRAAWGAFLTPKGMIISDAWVIRDGDAAWVVVPGSARATLAQLFTRTLPPRLAKATDRSDDTVVHWLCGGIVSPVDNTVIAMPEGLAPFAAILLGRAGLPATLGEQGWHIGAPANADVLKVLLGWPSLGREIDDRTLPQEVRFDELGGVRYDKGCYTGQETVSRLHFRGHANRTLRGVRWGAGETPTDPSVLVGDKVMGTLRTIVQLGSECYALALLRREVGVGESVRTGESDGVVIEPPFAIDPPAVA
jgi:folate-binding protein YgfZ